MIKMVYLVDFENVTSAGISGIQRLTKDDKVYIFYTVNAATMSFAAHLNLLSSPAEIIYYNVASGGKNALDFQLSSFLGYLISKGEEKSFCIISNDKGYEYVRTFWEKNGLAAGISINGAPSINKALLPSERPFAAKIQQGLNNQGRIDSAEQEETAGIPENKPIQKPAVQEAAPAAALPAGDSEEAGEKPKKRGRPKGKKNAAQVISADAPAETAEPAEAVPAKKAKGAEKKNSSGADPANAAAASEAKGKKPAPNSHINAAVDQLKPLLAKAGITDLAKVAAVVDLLKKAEGKQQFYRNMLTIFGMEKGVVVYKAIRPEYTNLTKLVKQQA